MIQTETARALPIAIPKHDLSRDEWLAARNTGIGSSDIATVCGLNPYRTAYDLYLEKIGEKPPEDLSDNPAIYFGTVLEEVVAAEFSKRSGRKVRRSNFVLRSTQHPWMLANLDRMIVAENDGEPEILECKTVGYWAAQNAEEWGPDGTDQVPERYMLQVQHQLGVTGRKRAFLAALIAGQDFRIYEIARNDQIIESIVRIGAEFWACVQQQVPPPALTVADARAKFPFAVADRCVEADDDALSLYREYCDLDDQVKALEKQRDNTEGKLLDFIGDGESLTVNQRAIWTWRQQSQMRFSEGDHAKENPDCHARFKRPRVFRVSRCIRGKA